MLVTVNLMVGLQDGMDRCPSRFNCVLTGEECFVAGHGIAQEQLVGRLPVRLLFTQIEFPLVADELLPAALDASGEGDRGIRR